MLTIQRLTTVLCAVSFSGCGPTPSKSKLNEAPDLYNLRDRFGIVTALSWDDIIANKSMTLPSIPWTDTYWPLTNQETAARWGEISSSSSEEVGLARFIETFGAEAAKIEPSPLLSPAEKYDIVSQNFFGQAISETTLQKSVANVKAIDGKIKATTDFAEKKRLVRSMISELQSQELRQTMSMSTAAWNNFLYYSSSDEYKYLGNQGSGSDWGWMGICHGWAPAAVMIDPPKHAVMAEVGQKKVLFSQGDIRGLLSRSWAQEAPYQGQFFLGRRCNDSVEDPNVAIPANSKGKGYAGTVTIAGTSRNFTIIDSLTGLQVSVRGQQALAYRIKIEETSDEKILLELGRGSFYMLDTFGELVQYLSNQSVTPKSVQAKISGCWDVNPASFHEVLVEQLEKRKVGFVMDRTRTGQVWNQPVYAAKFDISSLKSIDEVNDVAREYRSSGTAFLAEVTATVEWIGEPYRQQLVYDKDFDRRFIKSSTYHYTLEFDSQKRLIGGEWGDLDSMDPGAQAPDFLFGYKKGLTPMDNLNPSSSTDAKIAYSQIIKKIQECSRASGIDGEKTVAGIKVEYKNCKISP